MAMMSVPQAAAHLGVSEGRVRQRIKEGSLVASKVGGRWLLDRSSIDAAARPARGRPVSALSVWHSVLALDGASLSDACPGWAERVQAISPASRHRAVHRLASALARADHDGLLSWLRNRGERRLYVASEADLAPLRDDARVVPSGVSHPDSGLIDLRVGEGYVAEGDLDAVVQDHWLEPLSLEDTPNVVLHVVPLRPPRISSLLLAADLAEHGSPRELRRAHELLDAVIAEHTQWS
jgi:excisionase family DNA binding protein